MKKLLILTDFSALANHAAGYGYELAKQLNADITLCNAAIIAADIPLAGLAAWPLEERDTYLQNSREEITLLIKQLERHNLNGKYRPVMTFVTDPGTLINVLDDTLDQTQIDLVIMGAHNGDHVHTFLLDDRCMNMIRTMHKPLLMIPSTVKFTAIKKITFITDFKQYTADLKFISLLIMLAEQLDAVVSVVGLDEGKETSSEMELRMKNAKWGMSYDNHPNVKFTMLKHSRETTGLAILYEPDETGILAVIHRPDNFFDQLLHVNGSVTLENHLSVPLLIFKD